MYLVKALSAIAFPLAYSGPNVEWASGAMNLVDDNMLSRVQAHADVMTVVAGPDMQSILQAVIGNLSSTAAGTKNGTTVAAAESYPVLHTTVLTLTATPVTVTDDPGVAQYGGTGKIYSFPEGLVGIQGCVVAGALTLGTTGTIIDAFTGVTALGTATASTGSTLTGAEADIMASNAVGAATSKVATIDGASTTLPVLDGTAAAKDVYLNFAIADDATHTSGTGHFTGTVTINWVKLGDN
jgi:hypothetical protein